MARVAGAEPGAVCLAMELARVRFDDPKLGIPDLAEAAGLSAYYFMRRFRAATA